MKGFVSQITLLKIYMDMIIIFNQQDIIRDAFNTTHNNKLQNIGGRGGGRGGVVGGGNHL